MMWMMLGRLPCFWPLAVLLAQLVEPFFDFFVLGRPLLAVLCFQDIKLCIMNDLFR